MKYSITLYPKTCKRGLLLVSTTRQRGHVGGTIFFGIICIKKEFRNDCFCSCSPAWPPLLWLVALRIWGSFGLTKTAIAAKTLPWKRIPTGFKYHMGVNFPGVDFLRTEPKKNKDGFVVGCFIVFIKSGFIKDRIRWFYVVVVQSWQRNVPVCFMCWVAVFVSIRALRFLTFFLSLPASLQELPDNKVNRE